LAIPHSLRRSAWASRTAAQRVGGFPLLAVLVYVADEYPAAYAGARTLEASVVSFYGVVLLLRGWGRVGCALDSLVSTVCILSVDRAPGCVTTCGAIREALCGV
jgi:hypothetical protein